MSTEIADARMLLRQPPDDYVAERARLVKQARADGDRAGAKFLQSLTRPNLALWAVLVAGADAEAVRALVTATSELAAVQGGGARADAVVPATQHRRKALEALVDHAVQALAASLASAESRRGEIREIIDQLSRHPELTEVWTDGTLRDLPEEEFGFTAFSSMPDVTESQTDAPVRARRTPAPRKAVEARTAVPVPVPVPVPQRSTLPADDRAALAARAQRSRQARKDVTAAARDLAAAERRVEVARSALQEAETEMRLAEDRRLAVEQRHREATARLAANAAD